MRRTALNDEREAEEQAIPDRRSAEARWEVEKHSDRRREKVGLVAT
jgi:hypothetical protein